MHLFTIISTSTDPRKMLRNGKMFFAFLLPFLLMNSMAESPGMGPCKGPQESVQDFDVSKWLGVWYVYASYPLPSILPGKCRQVKLIPNPDGSITGHFKRITNTPGESTTEHVTLQLMNDDSNFTITNLDYPPSFSLTSWILETDYTSYTIKDTCVDFDSLSLNVYIIMTRSAEPSEEVLTKIQNALTDLQIPEEYFMLIDQKDCPASF